MRVLFNHHFFLVVVKFIVFGRRYIIAVGLKPKGGK